MTLPIRLTPTGPSYGRQMFSAGQTKHPSTAIPSDLSERQAGMITRLIHPWVNLDGDQPSPKSPMTFKSVSEWLVNQPSQRSLGLTPTAAQPLIKRVLDERLAELVQDSPARLHRASRIADVIKTAQRIAIAAPFAPSGQATDTLLVASSLASRLKTLWPDKTIDLITPISRPRKPPATHPYYDAMITLGLPQLTKAPDIITQTAQQSQVVINIDNALTNGVYGTPGLNWINPFCPNRALLVQALLAELPKLDQGTALLLGQSNLITHQRFTKNTFSPSDHQLFADIVDTGVDTQRYFNLSPTLSMGQLPLLGHAFSNLQQHGPLAITHLPPASKPLSKAEWVTMQERLMEALDIPGVKTLVVLQSITGQPQTVGWMVTKYPDLLPTTKQGLFQKTAAIPLRSWVPPETPTSPMSLRPLGKLKGMGFQTHHPLDATMRSVIASLELALTEKPKPMVRGARPKRRGKQRFGSRFNAQLYGQSALPTHLLATIRDPSKKRVLVVAHSNPDGDALGSILGLAALLKAYGKDVTVGYDGLLPRGMPYLPGQETLISFADFQARQAKQSSPQPFDISFLLDSSGLDRAGPWQAILEQATVKINIDHHPTPVPGFDQSWIDLRAASTTELIALLAQTLDETEPGAKKPLLKNPDIQACLYRGMVTDTGSFLYGSTPRTHQLAAKLSGGSSRWVKRDPRITPPPKRHGPTDPTEDSQPRIPHLLEFYQLQGQVLSGAIMDPSAKRILLKLTQPMIDATKATILKKHQLAQRGDRHLNAYKDLDMTKLDDALMVLVKGPVSRMAGTLRMDDGALPNQLLIFHQIGPDVRISFRYQHAGEMAQWFGGGGHAKAAGAQVPNQTVDVVMADFEQRLKTTALSDDEPRRQWIQYLIQDSLAIERASA